MTDKELRDFFSVLVYIVAFFAVVAATIASGVAIADLLIKMLGG